MLSFGGLWYEYAYTADFVEKSDKECATWNLLVYDGGENAKPDTQLFEVLYQE